jgi:hypothetical protein
VIGFLKLHVFTCGHAVKQAVGVKEAFTVFMDLMFVWCTYSLVLSACTEFRGGSEQHKDNNKTWWCPLLCTVLSITEALCQKQANLGDSCFLIRK